MRPVIFALLLCACLVHDPPPPLTNDDANAAKPLKLDALALPKLDGTKWTLASERGQVVLLDVWATWCDPCRDSLPMYHDFNKEYGPKGLKVWAINVDAESKGIEPFLKELKVQVPVLVDPNGAIAEQTLKVKVMPTSFLFDRKGTLRYVHEGFAEEFLSKYTAEIETLLKETP
jgi:thiol-disulfide isomerase/thioredoxin